MAHPEQLAEARKKAKLSPLNGKHGKWKKTIEREKRRELFDEIISQDFPQIIADARPEYKLDQFIGKAMDILDITSGGKTLTSIQEEALTAGAHAYGEKLRENKTK